MSLEHWKHLRRELTARRILQGLRSPKLTSVLKTSPGCSAILATAQRMLEQQTQAK